MDLAEIANQLDEQERHRMAEGGTESQAYQHFIEVMGREGQSRRLINTSWR